eukprot:255576_1
MFSQNEFTEEYNKYKKIIFDLKVEKEDIEYKMKRRKQLNKAQAKVRAKKKKQDRKIKKLETIGVVHFDTDFCHYDKPGRPLLENTIRGKDLIETMDACAESISCTDPRRRTSDCIVGVTIKSYSSIVNDKMQENNPLHHHIYEEKPISTSSIRKRTKPPKSNTRIAEEWYINPDSKIKFRKVQNSHSQEHEGAHFCLGQRKYVDTFAVMNAPDTIYISLDNQFDTIIGNNSCATQSKNNRSERGMVEISKRFVGQSLAVFKHGEHLKNGIVIDESMCLSNINAAGRQAVGLIDGAVVDGYKYHAFYVEPLSEEALKIRDDSYYANDLRLYQTVEHFKGGYNFVQFVNCCNPDNCLPKICKKNSFNSNIKRRYPPIFISPPIVFDNQTMNLVNPMKLPNRYHFAGLVFAGSQHIRLPNNFHHDTYNAYFQDKKKLLDKICPFCFVNFASKTAVLKHRRTHHKRQRADTDQFDDINIEINNMRQAKLDSIQRIINKDSISYLVEFKNGVHEYMILEDDNPKVIEFLRTSQHTEPPIILQTEADVLNFFDKEQYLCHDVFKSKPKKLKKRSRQELVDLDSDEYDDEITILNERNRNDRIEYRRNHNSKNANENTNNKYENIFRTNDSISSSDDDSSSSDDDSSSTDDESSSSDDESSSSDDESSSS